MFTRDQYKKAVVDFFLKNLDQYKRYRQVSGDFDGSIWVNDNLIAVVVSSMTQTLPTVIAAEIAFNKLVQTGKLQRTDGKDESDDAAAAVVHARENLEKAIANADRAPITKDELEEAQALSPRELSERYWGEDGEAMSVFAVRYRKMMREWFFQEPLKYGS